MLIKTESHFLVVQKTNKDTKNNSINKFLKTEFVMNQDKEWKKYIRNHPI